MLREVAASMPLVDSVSGDYAQDDKAKRNGKLSLVKWRAYDHSSTICRHPGV
jgi:hypothetical protein